MEYEFDHKDQYDLSKYKTYKCCPMPKPRPEPEKCKTIIVIIITKIDCVDNLLKELENIKLV
ncbi:TPA: hypothetical protein GXZ34_04220 [bacterium]|nr:hypothetical protein [bacterium]